MSEIRSAAASSIHAARSGLPTAVVMATGPLQPIKTPPLLSLSLSPLQLPQRRSSASAHAGLLVRRATCFRFQPRRPVTRTERVRYTHLSANQVLSIGRARCGNEFARARVRASRTGPAAFRMHKQLGAERGGCVTTPSLVTIVSPNGAPPREKKTIIQGASVTCVQPAGNTRCC